MLTTDELAQDPVVVVTRVTGEVIAPEPVGVRDSATPFVLVGYRGERGGFAAIAARRAFENLVGNEALSTQAFELTGYPQNRAILTAFQKEKLDYAVIDAEALLSTTSGVTIDQLVSLGLGMVGLITSEAPVIMCALPETALCNVDCVMSDWAALQRHEEDILNLEATYKTVIFRHAVWDSAAAPRMIREEEIANTLALCSEEAALSHGLNILQVVATRQANRPKYMIIARRGTPALLFTRPLRGASRLQCTLLAETTGRGALLDILSIFTFWNVVIDSLHTSDISVDTEWPSQASIITYRVSSDVEVEAAIQRHLAIAAQRVVVLGQYFSHTV